MKKHGIGSRLLSLLLALVMTLSVIAPAVPEVQAASKGDKTAGDTGITNDGDFSTDGEPVHWPIKIYDYLNDGMLFEFSQATHSSTDENLEYGGGMPMPWRNHTEGYHNPTVGNDYTQDATYLESAWGKWVSGTASTIGEQEVTGTIVPAVADVSPQYAHFEYKESTDPNSDATANKGTKFRAWVSDFYTDNGKYYDKDDVRYIVVVYRTNSVMDSAYVDFCLEDSAGNRFRGPAVSMPATNEQWAYFVYDMNATGTLVKHKTESAETAGTATWSDITNDIWCVSFTFPLNGIINGTPEAMDISHIAYFGSEEEANAFGVDALTFNNDPGVKLTSGVDAVKPTTSGNGWDFSYATSPDFDSSTITNKWKDTSHKYGGLTVTEKGNGPTYLNVTSTDDSMDMTYCWVGGSATANDYGTYTQIEYVTIVYRTHGITNPKLGFWLEDGESGTYEAGLTENTYVSITESSSTWVYYTYDLTALDAIDKAAGDAGFADNVDYFTRIGIKFPGFTSTDQSMDIAFIDYFNDKNTADAYGAAGANYMNKASSKEWNMGNNAGFGMLFASGGGEWETKVAGGDSSNTSNGYESYAIGELIQSAAFDGLNENRPANLDNEIYMIYSYSGGSGCVNAMYDVSEVALDGYTIYGTAGEQAIFTMGLIEPSLAIDRDADGNIAMRRIVYREETVDYIADLLYKALTIPRFDAAGNPNYNFVRGTAHAQFSDANRNGVIDEGEEIIDLAQALRNELGITFTEGADRGTNPSLGTYAEAAAKGANLLGEFNDVAENIDTCYDAAYYLLNNLFVDNSYNEVQNDYHYLEMRPALVDRTYLKDGVEVTETGVKAFVFDGGFTTSAGSTAAGESAVDYNTTTDVISNTTAKYKQMFYYLTNSTTTYAAFQPANDPNGDTIYDVTINKAGAAYNTDETMSPYFEDDGVMGQKDDCDTYVGRNYNYTMEANGEFVYVAEDGLFFEFEGDDDVYLFVNGQLVLDIGGGHSIANVSFDMNSYIEEAQTTLKDLTGYYPSMTDEVFAELIKDKTDAEKEKYIRAHKLNLQDGEVYSFDFYYMERHGYGANCRIVTNINITDPAMNTVKSAYQDDVEVEDGGIVNPDNIIEYGFTLTNDGNTKLYNLTFTDTDIGVELNPEDGLVVTGTQVSDLNGGTLDAADLIATVDGYSADGTPTPTIVVTFADNEALKQFLYNLTASGTQSGTSGDPNAGDGLWVDSVLEIRGIGYTMTKAQKDEGVFVNELDTSATNTRNKAEGTTLYGSDVHKVHVTAEPMYYQWAGHEIQITWDEFRDDIIAAASRTSNALYDLLKDQGLTSSTVLTAVTTANKGGTAQGHEFVTMDSANKKITIDYPDVGSHQFYVNITFNSKTFTIPVLANVTDVEDQVYVLDYGLNATDTLLKDAILTAPARNTNWMVMGLNGTLDSDTSAVKPSYVTGSGSAGNQISFTTGTTSTTAYSFSDVNFALNANDREVTFDPTDFLEDVYNLWIAVSVYDTGYDDFTSPSKLTAGIDVNKEVQMFQRTTVLPATVVYYEDDFPAIKYSTNPSASGSDADSDSDGKKNTFTRVGSSDDLEQSVDQSENYGHDDVYANANDASVSAGTLTTVTIRDSEQVAYFTFKGTGFEMISRTNAKDSATIEFLIYSGGMGTDGKPTGEMIERIPVITEFDNDAVNNPNTEEGIYQVPVIRWDEKDLGTYTVIISGIPARDYNNVVNGEPQITPTELYIDGLRIFQPLGASNDNYSDNENGAVFTELRDLVVDGKAALVELDETFSVSTSNRTWTENRNGIYSDGTTYNKEYVSSPDDYMLLGPNNELYMKDAATNAVAFYVNEKTAGTGNLQIAVHAMDEGLYDGTGSTGTYAVIQVGIKDAESGAYSWKSIARTKSGTEQYYTIPYASCPYVENVGYQVLLRVISATTADNQNEDGTTKITAMASFTTVKSSGLEIVGINGDAASVRYGEYGVETYNDAEDVQAWERYNTETGNTEREVDGKWVVVESDNADGQNLENYPAFAEISAQLSSDEIVDDWVKTEPEVTPDLFDIAYASMTMGNSLAINFAFEQDEASDWTGYYAEIVKTYADGREDAVQTVPYSEWKTTAINGTEHFYVTFNGIAAKEMTDDVYVTIYNADGEAVSNTKTDSVQAQAMRNLVKSDISDLEKTMVVDMLNYGAAAQEYFSYNTADLATAELTEEQKAYATVSTTYADTHTGSENYFGSNLVLKSNIQLLFAFSNVTADMTAEVTFTNHRGVENTITIDGDQFTVNGGYHVVTVEDLVVADARQIVKCTIYDGDTVIAEATDSVESYVARKSADGVLFEMLMKFSDSAFAYFHN